MQMTKILDEIIHCVREYLGHTCVIIHISSHDIEVNWFPSSTEIKASSLYLIIIGHLKTFVANVNYTKESKRQNQRLQTLWERR